MKKLFTTLTFSAIFSLTFLNAQQWGNYTLYSTMGSSNTYLIDTNNTNFKVWNASTADKTCYSSYLAPGGTLVRSVSKTGNSFTGGPICGKVQKVDFSGTLIWDYTYSTANEVSHHDHHVMPNGNVLLIAYDRKSASEVTTAGGTQSIEVWSEKIVEVQPTGATTGTIVWEWKLWDHLLQNVNPSGANYQSSIVNNPQLMNINYSLKKDWVHMNGIDYNPMLDQIVVSSHNLNEWWVIDHSTTTAEAASHTGGKGGKGGDFLYRWGNPAAWGSTGTAVLNVTHDAHWIPEGSPNAGRLVGFNNKGVSSSQSAVDQINVPVSGYNYTYGTPATYIQRHACSGYSSNMGNSNQLPNGNQLVCIATQGEIYELDPAGNTIWTKSVSGSVPQAHRYEACYVNNAAPATPTVSVNGSQLQSTAATTYQWYLNGVQISGATSQTYTPTQSGYYLVRITDANGCVYMYSQAVNFTYSTGISENDPFGSVVVYPNPSNDQVSISNTELLGSDYSVKFMDAIGNVILHEKNLNTIDLSAYGNGIYFISISTGKGDVLNRKITVIK